MLKTTGNPDPLQRLGEVLKGLEPVMVACSGGMDSGFLLWACTRFLRREQIRAVTFYSPTTPRQELRRAREHVAGLGVEHLWLATPEMEDDAFCRNDLLRCYYCKRKRFHFLRQTMDCSPAAIMEGSHLDDLQDDRPGMQALQECGIVSPMLTAHLTRADIQNLCRLHDLPLAAYPPESCLATRIKSGQRLSSELLSRIDALEEEIRSLGISLVRARFNQGEIRLEVRRQEIPKLVGLREQVLIQAARLGFAPLAIDLAGYDKHAEGQQEV